MNRINKGTILQLNYGELFSYIQFNPFIILCLGSIGYVKNESSK